MTKQTDEVAIVTDTNSLPPEKHSGSFWRNMGMMCGAVAFTVLAAAFYVSYMYFVQANRDMVTLVSQVNNKVLDDQQKISTLQKMLADTQQTVNSSLTTQQQVMSELHSSQNSKNNWRISEAQYLVDLANTNLQIGENIPEVIVLLQTADQKIRDASDPAVQSIRKALAADIVALQAVPVVDVSGIYLKLSALNNEIDKLSLPNRRPSIAEAQPNMSDEPVSWWRRGLHMTGEALSNKPGERPFIPPEQQDFLYQNLHATFEQALSAVVQRQPEIYRASLAQASQWIKQYFLVDAPLTQSMLNTLAQLDTATLRPALPTIAASLQAFSDYASHNDVTEKTNANPVAQP
jgi:uroporphyrin-3 C-methyltransferase